MNYQNRVSNRVVLVALIALIAGGIMIWVSMVVSPEIRETHTYFAIGQIVERLDNIDEEIFPRTVTALADTLKSTTIDWNSCRIEGDVIQDGWGQPITTIFNEANESWIFRSRGKDGVFGTEDDIEISTKQNPNK